MSAQIVMVSSSMRPNTMRRTYERLTGHGGVERLFRDGKIPKPWLIYCRRKGEALPTFIDRDIWEVTEEPRSRPFIGTFYRLFERADASRDFVFLEDDIAPCKNAVERAVNEFVPPWAGAMTFFDYRCEYTSPGVFPQPQGRDLWGSQALKFPARVMEQAKDFVSKRSIDVRDGTDYWTSMFCNAIGLTVAGFSPTIFQHIGMLSAYSPGRVPPVAANFPGEDYDAMVNGCEDPIQTGKWETVTEDLYCALHRKTHEPKDFGRCPKWRI